MDANVSVNNELLLLRVSVIEKNEMGGACSKYEGREEVYTRFWWGNLRERDHLEDHDGDGRIILRGRAWTESIWLRTGTGGEHL